MPTGDKISALTAASTLTGAELVPVVQGGVTKQATVTQLGAAIAWADNGSNLSHTGNTSLTALKTVTIPGGTVGPNGTITINLFAQATNPGAGTTDFYVKVDGTSIAWLESLANQNTAEFFDGEITILPYGTTALKWRNGGGVQSATIDLTADFDITFEVQNTNAGDTAKIVTCSVVVISGA